MFLLTRETRRSQTVSNKPSLRDNGLSKRRGWKWAKTSTEVHGLQGRGSYKNTTWAEGAVTCDHRGLSPQPVLCSRPLGSLCSSCSVFKTIFVHEILKPKDFTSVKISGSYKNGKIWQTCVKSLQSNNYAELGGSCPAFTSSQSAPLQAPRPH